MPGENAEVHPLAARCRPERRTGSRCDTHGRFRLRRLSFDHARRHGVLRWHLRVQPVVASPHRVQAAVGPAVARSPARRPDTRRPFGRLPVEAAVLRSATAGDEPQSLMRKIRGDFALKQNCLPPNAVIKLSNWLLCRGGMIHARAGRCRRARLQTAGSRSSISSRAAASHGRPSPVRTARRAVCPSRCVQLGRERGRGLRSITSGQAHTGGP